MGIDDIEGSIAARLGALAPLNATVKLDMGGDGVLFLDARGAAATLNRGDGDADCTLGITAVNMRKLIAGRLNPLVALAFGRLTVSGDRAVAAKLGDLLKGAPAD